MTSENTSEYFVRLVRELCKLPAETEWVEFKINKADPQEIGEYISAIANSAALAEREHGYLVWGVENDGHRIVGTTFSPLKTKRGNQQLENWLLQLISPRISFQFVSLSVDGEKIVVLQVPRANSRPVQFQGQEFIRIGSQKRRLSDYPEKERTLWRIFDQTPFEEGIAADDLTTGEVLGLIDYPAYFSKTRTTLPESPAAILEVLEDDRLVRLDDSGRWSILNLGAILFASNLPEFASLRRKSLRVIQYEGNNRVLTIREREGRKGYARRV